MRYAPGEAFVNSKQRRIPVSLDAPIFTLTHTSGFKGVLGGEYNFNRTEASIWKRFWLPSSWGKVDVSLKGGAEWNTVPFPLLILKKLKWREMVRFRALWGTLTDKNNPFKSDNPELFLFPMRDGQYTSHVMDPKIPYMEASVGVYNIFKLLHVEYVHRLTYRNNPDINKWGIRFMVMMTF